jgi:hypothetical protein
MAKNVVVLGTQWGDEGKGKVVDLLTDQAAYVATTLVTHLSSTVKKPYCTLFLREYYVKT